MAERFFVILVPSTSHALVGEKILRRSEIEVKLIPVPRHLSSDCGMCLKIPRPHAEKALSVLRSKGIAVEGCYPFEP